MAKQQKQWVKIFKTSSGYWFVDKAARATNGVTKNGRIGLLCKDLEEGKRIMVSELGACEFNEPRVWGDPVIGKQREAEDQRLLEQVNGM